MAMKLTYFNLRGLAEVSRYMLHMGGATYEDFRLPIDVATFAKPEFDANKAAGQYDANMGRIPILEVDGQAIAQSKPIERFVAAKYGFMGDSPVEAAQIDAVCEHVRDIKDAYQKVRGITDEAQKAEGMTKWFASDLPEWLGKLEKALASTSKSTACSVGSKMSLADIVIYYFLVFFFDNVEGAKAAYSNCPTISAVVSAVGANDKVKEWEAKRPDTKF